VIVLADAPFDATLRRHYSGWRLGLKPHSALIDSRETPLWEIPEVLGPGRVLINISEPLWQGGSSEQLWRAASS
jgi:hypothetical protein